MHCIAPEQASQCPLWVVSGHSAMSEQRPLYPRKRTSLSASANVRFVPKADIRSFIDDLIGAGEDRLRNCKPSDSF